MGTTALPLPWQWVHLRKDRTGIIINTGLPILICNNQPLWWGCGLRKGCQSPRSLSQSTCPSPFDDNGARVIQLWDNSLPIIEGHPEDLNPRHHHHNFNNQPITAAIPLYDSCTLPIKVWAWPWLWFSLLQWHMCVCVCVCVYVYICMCVSDIFHVCTKQIKASLSNLLLMWCHTTAYKASQQ